MKWGRWIVLAALVALLAAPAATAEQATSRFKRAQAAFLEADGYRTCAVFPMGKLRCWGENEDGQLGYGIPDDIGDNEHPTAVGFVNLGGKNKVRALGIGDAHGCAILQNRKVKCWGDGGFGRLGYGNTDTIGDNETPAAVGTVNLGSGRTARAITAGENHTCVILDNRKVKCWGRGVGGRLGYGIPDDIGDNETPAAVGAVNLGPGRTAKAISAGGSHTCVIMDTNKVKCWGTADLGALGYGNENVIGDNETPAAVGPVNLGPGRTAIAISAGEYHTCAILDNGKVRCWGFAESGQLGYGDIEDIGDNELPTARPPVSLGAGRKAVAISAGYDFTCAILDTGRVRCWGINDSGSLGLGHENDIGDNELPSSVPVVNLGRKAVAVSAGWEHACALLDNGKLRCWGYGARGQLGYANTNDIGDNELPNTVGPVRAGGLVPVKVRPRVSMLLRPGRDTSFPYRANVSGKLAGFAEDYATCTGAVVVKATLGGSTVSSRRFAKLGKKGCGYSARLGIPFGGTWKITAAFSGNGSLRAAKKSRSFRTG